MILFALLFGPEHGHGGVGLEWMPIASIVAPLVLLILLIWLGSRHTV